MVSAVHGFTSATFGLAKRHKVLITCVALGALALVGTSTAAYVYRKYQADSYLEELRINVFKTIETKDFDKCSVVLFRERISKKKPFGSFFISSTYFSRLVNEPGSKKSPSLIITLIDAITANQMTEKQRSSAETCLMHVVYGRSKSNIHPGKMYINRSNGDLRPAYKNPLLYAIEQHSPYTIDILLRYDTGLLDHIDHNEIKEILGDKEELNNFTIEELLLKYAEHCGFQSELKAIMNPIN
ncbi:MAG TPA: hypothetical protein PLO43_02790 [Chlamydiales bacterium]|nr:hypothetical protein [Chlamydiales bacterium]